jgi:predicted TIM-barrel fold metal-dependent hydrolase
VGQKGMMKIDFHVHITPPEIINNWEKYAQKDPYFSLLCQNKYNKFATAEDVISAINGTNENSVFDKAVVFGFAFQDIGLCRYVNDYVIEKTNQYPDRLIGFMVIPPKSPDVVKEIERCHNAGLAGVGELYPQLFNIENETKDLSRACKEFDLPLLLHANEPVGHYYTGKTDVSLKQLETFVMNNPDLKIILAHWGGGILFYELMKEVKESFRNVYYDTAAAPFLYDSRIYSVAKALDLCEKILFGSDFPILPQARYMDTVENSSLSAEDKELILGKNAKKLLRI